MAWVHMLWLGQTWWHGPICGCNGMGGSFDASCARHPAGVCQISLSPPIEPTGAYFIRTRNRRPRETPCHLHSAEVYLNLSLTIRDRYWTQDINSLNDHFGGDDDLKTLSTALHNRSMYLMVDVVANHMASSSDPPDYSELSPFSSKSSFHSECFISHWDNQTEIEQCWLGDTNLPLADLNTEDDAVVKALYAWIQTLVGEYGIDGVRIDTVKHIRKDFWPDFVKSAGVFTLGEIDQNDVDYVAPYTREFRAAYVLQMLTLNTFQRFWIVSSTILPGSHSSPRSRTQPET